MNIFIDISFWIFIISFCSTVLYSITRKHRPQQTNGLIEFFNNAGQISIGILLLNYILQIPSTPRIFFASGFLLYFLFILTGSIEIAFKLNQFEEKKPSEDVEDDDGEWFGILIIWFIFGGLSLSFLFDWSYSVIKWGGWFFGALFFFYAIYELVGVKKITLSVIANLTSGLLLTTSMFLIGYYIDDSLNSSYHFKHFFSDTHFKFLNNVLYLYSISVWIKILIWGSILGFIAQLIRISTNNEVQPQKQPLQKIRKKSPKEKNNKEKLKSQTTIMPKRIVNDIEKLTSTEKTLFFKSFFSLMGKISAIDGDVSAGEIQTIESMMKSDLNLSGSNLRMAKKIFKASQDDSVSVEEIIIDFKKNFPDNHNIYLQLIEALLRVAYSDGAYDKVEEDFIKSIHNKLSISSNEYEKMKTQYYFEMIILKLLDAIENLPNSETILEVKRKLHILFESIHSPFLVTVLGEFSAGKSTFINALVNKKLLAMKISPTTATITKLHYGDDNKLDVIYKNGTKKSFDKTDLHTLTVEKYVDEEDIQKDIHYVSLTVDDKLLQNIDIADTPGFNSKNAHHTEITSNFIAYADAIIWLFDANQMAKKSTFKLIDEYCKYNKPIAIINKIDQVDEEEREEVIPNFINILKPYAKEVFAISSKLAINSKSSDREKSGINKVSSYFLEEVVTAAVENKSHITLIKLIQIVILLNDDKKQYVDCIEKFERKLDKYELDYNNYEDTLKNHNDSANNYESDMMNNNLSYYDILMNINNYFIGRTLPKTIKEKTKGFISEFNILNKNNEQIEEWYSRIDEKEITLSNEIDKINSRWEKYNSSFLGGKKILDDLFGDVTDEKKHLNRDSNKWDVKRNKWQTDCNNYNDFLQKTNDKWERLNSSLNNFTSEVADKVFENADKINKEGERLSVLYNDLEKSNDIYENNIGYNEIFENDILNISNEISKLFSIKANQKLSVVFSDFESLIKSLQKQHIKHEKLVDKKVYNRKEVAEVIDLSQKKDVIKSYEKKTSDNLQEEAPKIN